MYNLKLNTKCKINLINIISLGILFLFGLIATFIFIDFFKLNKKENFSPGKYPQSVDDPLLTGFYPTKEIALGTGVSDEEYQDIYKEYPAFPSNNVKNNNIKDWNIPDNGTCSRAEMCNTLYNSLNYKDCYDPIANPLLKGGIRINYFNSKLSLPL